MKIINIIIVSVCFLTFKNCLGQLPQQNINSEIIGSWVSEDDANNKLTFNSNGECKEFYNNVLVDTYTYSISHQCANESDNKAWFLKMIDSDDLDERCYELYGANADSSNTLSIRDLTTGKIFLYNK